MDIESLASYVLIPLGGYMAFEDYRSKTIPLWAAIIFVVALFPLMHFDAYMWGIGFFVLLLLPLYQQWIAPVDAVLLAFSPLVLPLSKLPLLFILTGLGLIFLQRIMGEKKIPFLTMYIPIFLVLLLWR